MSGNFRLPELIDSMATNSELWKMGHGQDHSRRDLGLGWTYYGLTRSLRPKLAVAIGSWRGFAPLIIGQAIQDNDNDGKLRFIDPSFVDEHWKDEKAKGHFESHGVFCIDHYQQTSQQFIANPDFQDLAIDLLFIDGLHTEEQCRLEFEAFSPQLTPNAITLFHDSHSKITSNIYGNDSTYEHTTWRYINELKGRPDLQVFDLPIAQGISLVQQSSPATGQQG